MEKRRTRPFEPREAYRAIPRLDEINGAVYDAARAAAPGRPAGRSCSRPRPQRRRRQDDRSNGRSFFAAGSPRLTPSLPIGVTPERAGSFVYIETRPNITGSHRKHAALRKAIELAPADQRVVIDALEAPRRDYPLPAGKTCSRHLTL